MIDNNVDMGLIKNKKIMVGTPMFGGNASVGYISSILQLTKICSTNNIDIDFYFRWNESLITRARNCIVDNFLKTDCDYLFFIDADISFNPYDFLSMVELAEKDKEKKGEQIKLN